MTYEQLSRDDSAERLAKRIQSGKYWIISVTHDALTEAHDAFDRMNRELPEKRQAMYPVEVFLDGGGQRTRYSKELAALVSASAMDWKIAAVIVVAKKKYENPVERLAQIPELCVHVYDGAEWVLNLISVNRSEKESNTRLVWEAVAVFDLNVGLALDAMGRVN